jgi:hypothetical protein
MGRIFDLAVFAYRHVRTDGLLRFELGGSRPRRAFGIGFPPGREYRRADRTAVLIRRDCVHFLIAEGKSEPKGAAAPPRERLALSYPDDEPRFFS